MANKERPSFARKSISSSKQGRSSFEVYVKMKSSLTMPLANPLQVENAKTYFTPSLLRTFHSELVISCDLATSGMRSSFLQRSIVWDQSKVSLVDAMLDTGWNINLWLKIKSERACQRKDFYTLQIHDRIFLFCTIRWMRWYDRYHRQSRRWNIRLRPFQNFRLLNIKWMKFGS